MPKEWVMLQARRARTHSSEGAYRKILAKANESIVRRGSPGGIRGAGVLYCREDGQEARVPEEIIRSLHDAQYGRIRARVGLFDLDFTFVDSGRGRFPVGRFREDVDPFRPYGGR